MTGALLYVPYKGNRQPEYTWRHLRDIRDAAKVRRRMRVCPVVRTVDPAAQDHAVTRRLVDESPIVERMLERFREQAS